MNKATGWVLYAIWVLAVLGGIFFGGLSKPTTLESIALVFFSAIVLLVIYGLVVAASTRMAAQLGFQPSLLGALISRERVSFSIFWALVLAVGLGVALGAMYLVFFLLPNSPLPSETSLGMIFIAAVGFEMIQRLFLLTFVGWLFFRKRLTSIRMWIAIIITALILTLLAIPLIWPLDFLSAVDLVILTLTSVVFGWLYWKRGLEMAIIAHIVFLLTKHQAILWIWQH